MRTPTFALAPASITALLVAVFLLLSSGTASAGSMRALPTALVERESPGALALAVIGNSAQGRPIIVSCTGSGQTVLFVGGLHTGPTEGVTVTLGYEVQNAVATGGITIPEGIRFCIIPAANPDGVALGTRVNAYSVDLNRNWPADDWTPDAYHPGSGAVSGGENPLSEPETSALYRWVIENRPAAITVWHCCGALVEANSSGIAPQLGHDYASAAGLAYIETWTAYSITGQFLDAMDRVGIPLIDIELARSDSTAFDQHRAGVEAVLARVSGVSVTNSTVQGADPAALGSTGLYRIQAGDTISAVATRFGVSAGALLRANYISRIEQFSVGRLIQIPPRGS